MRGICNRGAGWPGLRGLATVEDTEFIGLGGDRYDVLRFEIGPRSTTGTRCQSLFGSVLLSGLQSPHYLGPRQHCRVRIPLRLLVPCERARPVLSLAGDSG